MSLNPLDAVLGILLSALIGAIAADYTFVPIGHRSARCGEIGIPTELVWSR